MRCPSKGTTMESIDLESDGIMWTSVDKHEWISSAYRPPCMTSVSGRLERYTRSKVMRLSRVTCFGLALNAYDLGTSSTK